MKGEVHLCTNPLVFVGEGEVHLCADHFVKCCKVQFTFSGPQYILCFEFLRDCGQCKKDFQF